MAGLMRLTAMARISLLPWAERREQQNPLIAAVERP